MIQVEPLKLEFNGVRLEPLSLAHANGLRAAAEDGELCAPVLLAETAWEAAASMLHGLMLPSTRTT